MTSSNPTFTVYCGPMFSSKSTKLLSTLERYKYQKKKVAVFKPTIDDRYSAGEVVTHSGWSVPAHTVKTGADILDILVGMNEQPDVVAVDEAFMINDVSEVLIWLYQNGLDIIVSSLDLSSGGKSFAEIEKILPWATHIEKCAAVCTVCARDAFYTYKKHVDDIDRGEIHVGGSELYEPRCAQHHPSILKHDDIK